MKFSYILILLLLTACTGRYASLQKPMSDCGYPNVKFSEFNACMQSRVYVNEKGPRDYYYAQNKEILATLSELGEKNKAKKIKDKDAYVEFSNYIGQKNIAEQESMKQAGMITAVALVGVGAVACARNGCVGGNNYAQQYYDGNCECPADIDAAGNRCGARSAYSRSGGATPYCAPHRL